jgi:sortase (surface protein transpeptidase)
MAIGGGLLWHATFASQSLPPLPPSSGVPPLTAPGEPGDAVYPTVRQAGESGQKDLRTRYPVRIDIPNADIHAVIRITSLGASGDILLPQGRAAADAVWYDGSAVPGQPGASVVLGHLDSHDLPSGKAAFYNLGAARSGDEIDITQADGRPIRFLADAVTFVSKKSFPMDAVFAPTVSPTLRLVTCGGLYTPDKGYDGYVIVFARIMPDPPDVSAGQSSPRHLMERWL